jgi:hypothetical protein
VRCSNSFNDIYPLTRTRSWNHVQLVADPIVVARHTKIHGSGTIIALASVGSRKLDRPHAVC